MSVQYPYGTFQYEAEVKPDGDSDIERMAPRDETSPISQADIAMRPLADQASETASINSDCSYDSAQAGVKRLEAISSTWSKSGLTAAYLGIALISFVTSLEGQTTINLAIFATSAFSSHALIATVGVVQAVVLSVVKPPMSKIADVLGRLEAFTISVVIFVLGYIQQATAGSVQTYASAQIFYSAGSTGLQILIQIFVADTSDLVNRALCSSLPQAPFLVTVWIGPLLAESILQNASWRWGYGIWVLILPVAFLPLALALIINHRKAAKRGLLPESQFKGKSGWEIVRTIWYELDVFGLVLICAAFSLILIPLTLAASSGWRNPRLLAMLLIGIICLIVFPFWERSKTLAPRAFFPRDLFRQRTVSVGMAIAFFYFMAYYLSVYPYFQSYLLVVQGQSIASAGRIVQVFTFSATITVIAISFVIRYTKRYKYFIVIGSIIYVLGLALMVGYRTEESSMTLVIITQIVLGIGGGLINNPTQLGVQASATHQELASATAIFLTILEIGGAAGNAISGAIWTYNVPKKLELYLPVETKDQAAAIYGSVSLAATGWPMGSPTRIAINRAYQETMTKILTVAVCVAAPCIVLSFFMKDYKLDEVDQHVKGLVIGGTSEIADRRDSMSAAEARSSMDAGVPAEEDEDEDTVASAQSWRDEQTRSLMGNTRTKRR